MFDAGCAIALTSAPALGVFTGIDLREDKGQIPPLELAQIDPLGLGVRVINLYATFDGPGSYPNDSDNAENAMILVNSGDNYFGSETNEDPWRLNKSNGKHSNAGFYQDPFGGNRAPADALLPLFPTAAWDTYMDIGLKTVPVGVSDVTATGPFFEWMDQDSDGRDDGVVGAWFTSNPPAEQHLAVFNSDSAQHEVFLAQFTIVGLDAGAAIGGLTTPVTGEGTYEWMGGLFTGTLVVHTQEFGGGALVHKFVFSKEIPAPASFFLAIPCVVAVSRRCRCRA